MNLFITFGQIGMVFCIYKPYVRDLDDQGCSGDLPHLRQHAQCASAVREPNLRNF